MTGKHLKYAANQEGSLTHKNRRGITLVQICMALVIGVVLIALMLPAQRSARTAARRSQCRNNLRQIGLALHIYHDANGCFPPAYTQDASGNPLHSWRTLLLPYLDQEALFKTIDLSKPWDDAVNEEAGKKYLNPFTCPSANLKDNLTTYMAVVSPNSGLRLHKPTRLSDITNGSSNTLLVIEVAPEQAVHWMSPVDADPQLVFGLTSKTKLAHTGGMQALFADGTVRFLEATIHVDELRSMISIAKPDDLSTEHSQPLTVR